MNDFFISMKQLLSPSCANKSTFAAVISSTNPKNKANETTETIHSEFPDAHSMYYNVGAGDFRNGDGRYGSSHWRYGDGEGHQQWYGDRLRW